MNPSSPQPVWSALDKLELQYDRCVNHAGDAYARLAMQLAPDARVQFSVLRWNTTLVIRAHDLMTRPPTHAELVEMNLLNAAWAMGRVYYDRERGAWDAATGVHLLGEDADPTAVSIALRGLCSVAGYVHRHRAKSPAESPPAGVRDAVLDDLWAPYPRVNVSLNDIAEAAELADLSFERKLQGELLVQRFVNGDHGDFLVDMRLFDARLLFVRGRLDQNVRMPSVRLVLDALQQVNTKLSLGTAVLTEDGLVCFLLGFPLVWSQVGPDLVHLLVDHAACATTSMKRHLGLLR